MVAGLEVAQVIGEFEEGSQSKHIDYRHHDQTESAQDRFSKDVYSLVSVIEELGNPFQEESMDLIVLHTKEIASPEAVKTVQNVHQNGLDQFKAFTKECLVHRTKPLNDPIRQNKLKVFNSSNNIKTSNKGKQQLTSLKNDMQLFSRLYISYQTRDGNIEEFFRHENQACPQIIR